MRTLFLSAYMTLPLSPTSVPKTWTLSPMLTILLVKTWVINSHIMRNRRDRERAIYSRLFVSYVIIRIYYTLTLIHNLHHKGCIGSKVSSTHFKHLFMMTWTVINKEGNTMWPHEIAYKWVWLACRMSFWWSLHFISFVHAGERFPRMGTKSSRPKLNSLVAPFWRFPFVRTDAVKFCLMRAVS